VRWGQLNSLRLKRARSRFNTRFWAHLSPSAFLRDIEGIFTAKVERGEDWSETNALTEITLSE
jgi:hypothetical protein